MKTTGLADASPVVFFGFELTPLINTFGGRQ